ncbi:alpha-amylase family glycosyl hydrolase [Clostridium sp. DJ247]|uniref:pullulanase X25 domain-containing protein n=1 Tax=Clostridium sp. DJ247 TaxID=2726188 RepID=UPI001627E263|nr:alpha-amylase family glycosyl hydrolase [Clostridium sp. DJ247]MBC2579514.1 hypothetical protein [Clostridium sp. DJ247]
MKKYYKGLSLVVIFVFIISLIPALNTKVKADNGPTSDTMVTLVGDFIKSNDLGDDWQPTNKATIMKEYLNGIYELTVDFKTTGDYNYKVVLNGTWDKAYGDPNGKDGNKSISVAAPRKVTFRFDLKNEKVYDSINDAAQFKQSATLVGSLAAVAEGGKDWTPSDSNFDMDYIGGGFYQKSFNLKAGSLDYKVAFNHDWNNGEIGDGNGGNTKLTLDKDGQVTFNANVLQGALTDSIANPTIAETVSVIGTVRGDDKLNWDQTAKGYEFSPLTVDGKFIYSAFLKEGSYEYKAVENYSWDSKGLPTDSNTTLTVPAGGKYVVFIADAKGRAIYDSINNKDKIDEILGFQVVEKTIASPVINANGTVTFSYKNADAKSVYLVGSMTNGETNKILMTKDKNGIWSITKRIGDDAQTLTYKFLVDGSYVTDPSNDKKDGEGNSTFDFPKYTGRKVVLAGSIQAAAGEASWTPGSDKTTFTYSGNGNYTFTLKAVPAGGYEYKIAMGSWTENYGKGGVSGGANIPLVVGTTQDVTFWYNDDSHNVLDSASYKVLDVKLSGTGINEIVMKDETLSGIYSAKVALNKGNYSDLVVTVGDEKLSVGDLNITEDSKTITISYDPQSDTVYNDASNKFINLNELYFNSRDNEYKSPFGAAPQGTEITFNLKAAKDDITSAKLVITGNDGTKKTLPMDKNGAFDDAHDKWTVKYTPDTIGLYKYYFVVSNGSDVKSYGDDDGYFGSGLAGALGAVKTYDLNVYKADFKTPDWMKNAVIYQIFPDRFFNGDPSNDKAQLTSRGIAPYEFYNNWYAIPENPSLEYKKDANGQIEYNADGTPVIDPNYLTAGGTVGDEYKYNIWCNEMYDGDLKGIQDKLDYLQTLGVNVLYLNPISQSISNHRYDTTDYKTVDPLLGNMDNFVSLTTEAKKRGMHVILDGVFNHVSDDSIYFDRYGKYVQAGKPIGGYQYWSKVYDAMNANSGMSQADAEKKVTSDLAAQGITDLHYKDWFIVKNNKIDKDKDGNAVTQHYDYEGWYGYDSMPVIQALNGSEYNVKTWDDEIIDGKDANSRLWLEKGSNGWRLDVANEVSDETWRHFRDAVKSEGDNVIIGEIWTDASKYILGDMYDSVMNYRFRGAVLDYISGSSTADNSFNALEAMREQYPKEAFDAMLNLVDSHDTERVLSHLDGVIKDSSDGILAKPSTDNAKKLLKLVPLFQMTYPGAPCIYYGDEIGMVGAKDPDNRRAMTWGKGDKDIVEWYSEMANLRDNNEVLRTGDIQSVSVSEANNKGDIMAFTRNNTKDHAVVVINRGSAISSLEVNVNGAVADGTELTDAISGKEYTVSGGKVTLNVPEKLGAVLLTNYKASTVNMNKLKDAYDSSYVVPDKTDNPGVPATSDFTIENVNAVDHFTLGQDAKVTVKLTNTTSEAKSVALIVGLFDTNNHMVNYGASQQAIDSKKDVQLQVLFDIPSNGNYTVKYFIWDSLDTMKPLTQVGTIPVK